MTDRRHHARRSSLDLRTGAKFRVADKEEYLQIARNVVNQGIPVNYDYKGQMTAGFLQLIGNNRKGEAKFAFVGTNPSGGITTLHTKSGKEFWKSINGDPRDKVIRPIE